MPYSSGSVFRTPSRKEFVRSSGITSRCPRSSCARDLTDPNVIAQFAELVGTPEDLRMLCLLTYADMKAVSPEVLTSWKEDLLWQLYVATYYYLLHGFADDRYLQEEDIEGEINGILRFVASRVGVDDLRNFLDGVPRQYLRATPKDQIARHFEQYQKLSEEVEVVMHVARRDGFHEIMVMTPDRPYLFSRITGVLSSYGMNILRAQAFANRSGIVVRPHHVRGCQGTAHEEPAGGRSAATGDGRRRCRSSPGRRTAAPQDDQCLRISSGRKAPCQPGSTSMMNLRIGVRSSRSPPATTSVCCSTSLACCPITVATSRLR